MDWAFDAPPQAAEELEGLLERSGVDFRREGDRFSFLFASRGRRWQTVCDCRGDLALIYGIHPVPADDATRAAAVCSQLNSRLVQGAFFVQEGRVVLRTSARLVERTDAAERVARALEYNAAAMSQFWERLTAGDGAGGLIGPP